MLRGEDVAPDPWPTLDAEGLRTLLVQLDAHGVLGLLHARASAGADLPPGVADAAAHGARAVAAHGALQVAVLREVLSAFDRHGLPVLVLKGPALASSVYAGLSERPFGDLDLLTDPRSMDVASGVLQGLGFQRSVEEAPEWIHHWTFTRVGPASVPVIVELHRRLLASPPFDRSLPWSELYARSVMLPAPLEGARALEPVDGLLHLAAHLVLQHARSERLIWVSDIDRLVRRAMGDDDETWRVLGERATESGLAPSLVDALRAAAHWFATPIPAAWSPRPVSPELDAAHARVRARASVGAEGARLLSDLRGIRGIGARARFIRSHLLPDQGYMKGWYGIGGGWRLPIYYGRRLLRGVGHIIAHTVGAGAERAAAAEAPEQWMVMPEESSD